jgi:hypothetical protein
MCGRYSLTKSPQEIGKYFGVRGPEGIIVELAEQIG